MNEKRKKILSRIIWGVLLIVVLFVVEHYLLPEASGIVRGFAASLIASAITFLFTCVTKRREGKHERKQKMQKGKCAYESSSSDYWYYRHYIRDFYSDNCNYVFKWKNRELGDWYVGACFLLCISLLQLHSLTIKYEEK